MREVEMPSGHIVYDVPDGTTQSQLAKMYPQFMTPKDSDLSENQQQPGLMAGMGRGMAQRGVGIMQLMNDADTAVQKYLPKTLADMLTYEVGGDVKGVPTDIDRQQRGQTMRDVATNLQNQGKNTGFMGGLGETLGDPLTYSMAGTNLASQGAYYGATNAMTNPQKRDIGLEGRIKNAGIEAPIDAAGSVVVGKALGKLLQPFSNKLTPEAEKLAQIAQNNGIDLTAAQKSGNKILQGLETAFTNNPFTMGRQQDSRDKILQQFTTAALSKIGINAKEASPAVIDKAYNGIGGTIGSITKSADIPRDENLYSDVKKAIDQYSTTLNSLQRRQFFKYANDIAPILKQPQPKRLADEPYTAWDNIYLPNDVVPTEKKAVAENILGETYQKTRSQLGTIMKSNWKTDPNYSNALEALQDAIDDAAERHLPTEAAQKLSQARNQYHGLKILMKSMASSAGDASSGNVPAAAFTRAVIGDNASGYVRGKGDYNTLARIGSTFLKGYIPDSGTTTRQMLQKVITGAAPTGAGFAAGGTMGAAVGAILPMALQSVYQRFPNYLSKGAPISPKTKALIDMLAGRTISTLNPLEQ